MYAEALIFSSWQCATKISDVRGIGGREKGQTRWEVVFWRVLCPFLTRKSPFGEELIGMPDSRILFEKGVLFRFFVCLFIQISYFCMD